MSLAMASMLERAQNVQQEHGAMAQPHVKQCKTASQPSQQPECALNVTQGMACHLEHALSAQLELGVMERLSAQPAHQRAVRVTRPLENA